MKAAVYSTSERYEKEKKIYIKLFLLANTCLVYLIPNFQAFGLHSQIRGPSRNRRQSFEKIGLKKLKHSKKLFNMIK